ncbi:MAG: preprotein translocase subunit SecE [Verrucomicrobiia bacterium]
MNNDLLHILFWVVIIGAIFGVLWWKGYLLRMSSYVLETREELRKCTWPSVDELKGSTVLIMVTIALLGGFVVGVDYVLSLLVRIIT